jgi:protease IV
MNFISKLFWPITAPIKFIQAHFKTVLFLAILIFIFANTDSEDLKQPNLAIIELNGPIFIADEVLEKIEKAKTDQNIKGVLLKVNSPGGAVPPSIEIAYAIKELGTIKPVVAYASGIMASGSYYASIWANKIIANPGSMIGSIGVIMQNVDASELLEKIGIKPQTVKAGEYKESGTPMRQWTQKEKQELEKIIHNTYNMFVNDVANARGLDPKEHKSYADAHIFTAMGALQVGLIDEIATISRAKSYVKNLSGVTVPIWQKEDEMDKFMNKFLSNSISQISNQLNGLQAF